MGINDRLQDSAIKHQIDLQHYGNGLVKRMLAILNEADPALFAELMAQMDKMTSATFNVKKLDKLLSATRDLNTAAYASVLTALEKELQDFVDYEANYQQQAITKILPPQITIAHISAEQAYTAAHARPFQGKLLKEWMDGLETDKATRIRDTIRTGYVNNETIVQMVRKIKGSKATNYADGILEINRRNATTIVRSAIGHMAAFTRNAFLQANSDVIKAVQWSSTLDGRTSEPCRLRDGKNYTLDHQPIGHSLEWGGGAGNYHFNCRSSSIGIVKSWQDLGLKESDIPIGTRASINGQVPSDIVYGDWLKKQSASVQDDVLGKAKGKLFREGGLNIEQFANNKGKSYTLKELRERDAGAFAKAGL